jgi:hypothetical protein
MDPAGNRGFFRFFPFEQGTIEAAMGSLRRPTAAGEFGSVTTAVEFRSKARL